MESDEYPDGTYLVHLAPIEDESLVAGALLGELGVAENPERAEVETIIEHLSGKHALIVLDNCEHLIDACSTLVDSLIRRLPNVRVIATSLEPLMLPGEAVMPVLPLGVPAADGNADSKGSFSSDAVELFVRLAQQHRSDLAFGEDELRHIGELCRKLVAVTF